MKLENPKINIPTTLGTVSATFTDSNHAFIVIGQDNYNRAATADNSEFVIRGVAHRGNIHVTINDASGEIYIGERNKGCKFYQNIYTRRTDNREDSSYAAKDKIAEAIINGMTAFLKQPEGADVIAQAFVSARKTEIDREISTIEKTTSANHRSARQDQGYRKPS